MPISGSKPKPRNQIRHRVPPVHDWTEVVDVPFAGGPSLPRAPARPKPLTPPTPTRPLGNAGLELWERVWRAATSAPDAETLLQLCEQTDERQSLRRTVIKEGDWRERNGLRQLDAQITAGLVRIADAQDDARPSTWPAATRRWWTAISRLPHAGLWTGADWQFAMDTAHLVAAYHAGNLRLAGEIRTRERIMGTTRDARRDLRIRYVPAPDEDEVTVNPSVTAMDDYRRSVSATE